VDGFAAPSRHKRFHYPLETFSPLKRSQHPRWINDQLPPDLPLWKRHRQVKDG